jgi:hypothetical protein
MKRQLGIRFEKEAKNFRGWTRPRWQRLPTNSGEIHSQLRPLHRRNKLFSVILARSVDLVNVGNREQNEDQRMIRVRTLRIVQSHDIGSSRSALPSSCQLGLNGKHYVK